MRRWAIISHECQSCKFKKIEDWIKSDFDLCRLLVKKQIIQANITENAGNSAIVSLNPGDPTHYTTGDALISCGMGVLYRGHRNSDNLPVTMKIKLRNKISNWTYKNGRRIPTEISMMERINDPANIVKLLDFYVEPEAMILVCTQQENSTLLKNFISENNRIAEPLARKIFKNIVDSILKCCKLGVSHQNIRSENVIIDQNNASASLFNFDCAEDFKESKYIGLPCEFKYAPPEVTKHAWYYAQSLQTWQLGILLYEMVMGYLPFSRGNFIMNGLIRFYEPVSDQCKNLIKKCLEPVFVHRPTYREILDHPWMHMES